MPGRELISFPGCPQSFPGSHWLRPEWGGPALTRGWGLPVGGGKARVKAQDLGARGAGGPKGEDAQTRRGESRGHVQWETEGIYGRQEISPIWEESRGR